MKKVIFTFLLFTIAASSFSQTTYYWVGGASGSFSATTSWNTALNGSGTSIGAAPASTDILVFDGTNIGGSTPATGTVTPNISTSYSINQLKLQNGADVVFYRTSSGSAGTTTLTIGGDGTPADDFTIDATSSLKITAISQTNAQGFVVALGVAGTPATGTINGTVRILDGGFAKTYISVLNANNLFFGNGSNCYMNNTFASSYPLSPSGGATVNNGITFQSGSSLIYQGGNSPYTTTSAAIPMTFATGSNFIFEAAIVGTNTFNKHFLSNIVIRNNATVNEDGAPYHMDNVTINAGSTFNLLTNGGHPVAGNIVNNGTFGSIAGATTSHLEMIGTTPQSIGGTGTFNAVSAFTVATDANVTLNTNLIIGSSSGPPTSNISGKLNLQNFTISSTGTTAPGNISIRTAASVTTTALSKTYAGGYGDTLADAATYAAANVSVGNLVTGTGIPANTYIIATNSASNSFTLSNAATVTSTTGTITISNTSGSITTSNAGGVDGSITTTGTRTFGTGANYTFNTATTSPFSTSSNNTVGNITANANITSNKVIYTSGTITLNAAKFTIRGGDSLHLTTTGSFGGTYNSSQYIATDVSGATVGVVTVDTFTVAKTFPVGTPTYYMPVTLTPVSQSTFAVSVFQGITEDGTPTGTAFTAAKKAKVVDAVWTINRMTSNVDNCTMNLNWQSAQEGSSFTSYGNSQIGISRNSAGTWSVGSGSGNNTTNTATSTFSSFSPFAVGQVGVALPVKLTNIIAKEEQGKIKLQWNNEVETNTISYVVERSADGILFTTIGNVVANGGHQYSLYDNNPLSTNYYRIAVKDINGNISYSNIVVVKLSIKSEVTIYPNPVKGNVLNIQLSNLSKGNVDVILYNNSGQQVMKKTLEYNGGVQTQTIQLPATVVKGVYRLVTKSANESFNQTIVVE